jgi:hypothetical protein
MSEFHELTLDLGSSGYVALNIQWTDENGRSFEERILIATRGQKPKALSIEREARTLYSRIGQPGEEKIER